MGATTARERAEDTQGQITKNCLTSMSTVIQTMFFR